MFEEIISRKYKLYFNDIAVLPNKELGYASAIEFNGLFEVQIKTGECRYLMSFPGEPVSNKNIHFGAVYCDSKVFFFPQVGRFISIYDLNRREITQIDIPSCESSYYYDHIKIGQAFSYGQKIYAIGASYPYVIVIDSNTLATRFIPMNIGKNRIMFRAGGCFANDSFFIPSTVSGIVLSINLIEDKLNIYSLGEKSQGAWSMAFDGKDFWIAPYNQQKTVRKWNPQTGIICEYENFPLGYKSGREAFLRCGFLNETIWMWPLEANMFIGINPDSGEMNELSCDIKFTDKSIQTGCYFESNHCLYVKQKTKESEWYGQEGKDYIINLETLEIDEKSFVFAYGIETFLNNIYMKNEEKLRCGIQENHYFSLYDYIVLLSNSKISVADSDDEYKNINSIGSKIYKTIVGS